MNAIVEFVSGRCTNELFCAVASAREVVRVPAGASFVCNQCGKPLAAGNAGSGRGAGSTALIIGTGMALTGAGLFAVGIFLGGNSTPPATTPTRTVAATPSPVAAAPTAPRAAPLAAAARVPAPVAVAPPPVATAPAAFAPHPTVVPSQPVAAPSAAALAAVRPMPMAVAKPAPPPMPPQIVALGSATAVAPPAVERAARLRTPRTGRFYAWDVAPDTDATGGADMDAAEAATQAAQARAAANLRAQPVPPPAPHATPAQPPMIAMMSGSRIAPGGFAIVPTPAPAAIVPPTAAPVRVVVPPPATSPATRPAVAAAAKPAPATLPSRDFSARPVHGGGPAYPSEYEEQGRGGVVGVGCHIETSGVPTGCHVMHVAGGEAFGNAVLDWLRSGRVRFEPILRNGQPVAETQTWNVTFSP